MQGDPAGLFVRMLTKKPAPGEPLSMLRRDRSTTISDAAQHCRRAEHVRATFA